VATLVEGLQQAGKYKGKFKLFGLTSAVREVFELSRLDKVFEIYPNEDAAFGSLA
jgi:anti-anti-sigma regulatory factor